MSEDGARLAGYKLLSAGSLGGTGSVLFDFMSDMNGERLIKMMGEEFA